MTQTIREELMGATKLEPRKKESEGKFVSRLVRAASDESIVDSDTWDTLSEKAQLWVGDAVEAMNKKDPCPVFPDEKKANGSGSEKTASKTTAKGSSKGSAKSTKSAKSDKAPAREPVEKDEFGLRKGTARSEAAALFKKGAKMKSVKEETGTNHYNLLTQLEKEGHTVKKDGSLITLTPAK